jgi:microcystin-dependent protein
MPTQTPNYDFLQPTVGADDSLWGEMLNDNWGAIDTLLKTLQDSIADLEAKALVKIGGLYFSSDPADPATSLGYGQWEPYAEGRALVGVGNNGQHNWTVEEERGSETHVLADNELPSHGHTIDAPPQSFTTVSNGAHAHGPDRTGGFIIGGASPSTSGGFGNGGNYANTAATGTTGSAGAHTHSVTVDLAPFASGFYGGSAAHNNVQPSIAVHVWKRVA